MALPSKKSKFKTNLEPPKIGRDYLEYGLDRIEELIINSDKDTNYLPRTIEFEDIDIHFNEFVKDGSIQLVIDGKEVPVFYLENERWGEFSDTWKLMDGDKNVPTPYITIRRFLKKEGTRLGRKWTIPQSKTFKYVDVPILDDGEVIYLRFKIPEPTNVDVTYDIKLFTKYRVDVNKFDKIIMNAFKSRQEYLFIKGNPMPILIDSMEEGSTVENIDGDRFYVSSYKMRVQGFIQNEEEFEITRTSRQPTIGVDLSKEPQRTATGNIQRKIVTAASTGGTLNISNSDDSFDVDVSKTLDNYELPDIIITDYTGGTQPYPSVKNISLSGITPNPDNSIYYNYPLETQSISYRDGDAGSILQNEYAPLYSGRLGNYKTPRLEDYFTLTNNNSFGNRSRFTDITGGTISSFPIMGTSFFGTQKYIIDHFTGLGWSPDLVNGDQDVNWNTAIDLATGFTTEGFTDFHLPSVAEFATLEYWTTDIEASSGDFWKNRIFGFGSNENTFLWTSSTVGEDLSSEAYGKSNQIDNRLELYVNNFDKTANASIKYFGGCRIHFKADSQTQPDIETLNVSNSDDSYSANTGTNLILPDINILDYNNSSFKTFPSVQDIEFSAITTPSYAYPQLTQETSYRDGDEGWQLINVWNDIYTGGSNTIRSVIGLSDFYTLQSPNRFGNYFRFTNPTGGTADLPNGIVYDNYLGIQIISLGFPASLWDDYIDFVRGYDDLSWYPMPKIIYEELIDNDYNNTNNLNTQLVVTTADLWTSTSRPDLTTQAYYVEMSTGRRILQFNKSASQVRGLAYKLITGNTVGVSLDTINISNSDDSYSANTAGNTVLPDIQIIDYDGSSESYPSVKDINISAVTTPSYAYPQLSQTVSYRDGDEGWQVANVWNDIYTGNTNARKSIIGLTDFYTLESNNQFGNTLRFTTSGGTALTNPATGEGQNTNIDIYDNYLGIIIHQVNGDFSSETDWETYIDAARAFGDGSYYPMPRSIFQSLIDWDRANVFDAFSSINNVLYWREQGREWSATTHYITSQAVGLGGSLQCWEYSDRTKVGEDYTTGTLRWGRTLYKPIVS